MERAEGVVTLTVRTVSGLVYRDRTFTVEQVAELARSMGNRIALLLDTPDSGLVIVPWKRVEAIEIEGAGTWERVLTEGAGS